MIDYNDIINKWNLLAVSWCNLNKLNKLKLKIEWFIFPWTRWISFFPSLIIPFHNSTDGINRTISANRKFCSSNESRTFCFWLDFYKVISCFSLKHSSSSFQLPLYRTHNFIAYFIPYKPNHNAFSSSFFQNGSVWLHWERPKYVFRRAERDECDAPPADGVVPSGGGRARARHEHLRRDGDRRGGRRAHDREKRTHPLRHSLQLRRGGAVRMCGWGWNDHRMVALLGWLLG